MLTIRTAAQIRTARTLKSFRIHPTSTGIGLAQIDRRRRAWETVHLAVRQLRRQWLHECWMKHLCQAQTIERLQ
jgi:hypothetical protein